MLVSRFKALARWIFVAFVLWSHGIDANDIIGHAKVGLCAEQARIAKNIKTVGDLRELTEGRRHEG